MSINFNLISSGAEPCPVSHDLSDLENFSDRALLQLIARTPAHNLRSKRATQDRNEVFNTSPVSLREIENFFEDKSTSFWIVLNRIETDPVLKSIYRMMAESILTSLNAKFGGIHYCTGSMFISSCNATTPFHMDYGSNLLLQMRGNKHFQAYSPNDRKIVSEKSLQELFYQTNANPQDLAYCPEYDKNALVADLKPGGGIYMPSTSPHLTTTVSDNELSVTVSLSYLSAHAEHLRTRSIFNGKFPQYQRWVPQGIKHFTVESWDWVNARKDRNYSPRHVNFIPLSRLVSN